MNLRNYQQAAVDYAVDWFHHAKSAARLLLAAPTGTGKSYIELAIQERVPECLIVTPKIEIIAGLLGKMGSAVEGLSDDDVIATAAQRGIYTPIRLRNRLLDGDLKPPRLLIMDESHHDIADSWQDIHVLCGFPPAIGLTATPYRGTPKSTAAFRQIWGAPVWIITMPEAVERGVLSMPECTVAPLVDDDEISVFNGELVAEEVDMAIRSRLHAAAQLVTEIDVPTMFAVPSVDCTESLRIVLEAEGIRSVVVTGKTPYSERQAAFRACLDCSAVLIQVAVVSEGVDLPIRRLIDLSPTLSPVKWLQQFGRITRPGGRSYYVCTNRNLLRHGYLLDGCLPPRAMSKAQSAFPISSRTLGIRAVGLEAIGRLKPAEIPLRNGLTGLMYAISAIEGHKRIDYCAIVHPCREDVIWAKKESDRKPIINESNPISPEQPLVTYEYTWGRWQRCDPPEDLTGYASLPPAPISAAQQDWWKKSAAYRGLDPDAPITRKQFPILPVLSDLNMRLL